MTSKQKTLHRSAAFASKAAFCAFVWISCIVGATRSGAEPTRLAGTLGDQTATLRLIAAPGLTDGRYRAGVEIAMAPGSHTYWKQPGEAGVPPVFAFNGSDNVAEVKVRYPVPKRISEEGIVAFAYADAVVFPVEVTPRDPAKPAVLKADVTYAVCNKICMPAHNVATLTLTPGGAGIAGDKVTAALAEVPTPITDAQRKAFEIAPLKGDKPAWTLTWKGEGTVDDVFPIAPEGFYFETKALGPNTFSLIAAQISATGAVTKVPVALVLARGKGGIGVTETLDVTTPTR